MLGFILSEREIWNVSPIFTLEEITVPLMRESKRLLFMRCRNPLLELNPLSGVYTEVNFLQKSKGKIQTIAKR